MKRNSILLSTVALCAALISVSCKKDPQPDPSDAVKTYIIISDSHLGDSRSVSEGYGWNNHMKDTLSIFLDYLAEDKSWDELIIAGDMFEEWVSPVDVASMRDANGKTLTEAEFFQKLTSDNKAIMDKFAALRNSGRKLVYIPGNHDMLATSSDFSNCLAGVFDQARTQGVDGLGEYQPEDVLFIEHGHRYDILNAPYKGKCGVEGIPQSSILPSGFFECKLYTSSQMKETKGPFNDRPKLDSIVYDVLWDALGIMFGKDDVVTQLDGMTRTYTFDEYAGSDCLLFYHIDDINYKNDGWGVRCARNKAVFVPSVTTSILSGFVYDFCDQMGMEVLESGKTNARILVWGHSHSPKLITGESASGKVIYLNTGCWVDGSVAGAENTGTFGKIVKKQSGGYQVDLCRFDVAKDGTKAVTVIGTESL